MNGPIVSTSGPQTKFIAGLRVNEDGPDICTGSLITNRFMPTAAHCATTSTIAWVADDRRGVVIRQTRRSDSRQARDLSPQVPREQGLSPQPYDFLLLELKRASLRRPVQLANESSARYMGTRRTVVGDGRDASLERSKELRSAEMKLGPSNAVCVKQMMVATLDDSMMCARGYENTGPCHSDSGGPLLLDADLPTQRLLEIVGGGKSYENGACATYLGAWYSLVVAARSLSNQ